MIKIFIDGQEGTTGLKLKEKLADRSDLILLTIDEADRKNAEKRAELINESDLTFLCLPDAAAVEAVGLVTNPNTRIVDASTAHRTADGWLYGLPELYKDAEELFLRAKRVAVPGCHAGGFVSIVKPLIDAGLIDANEILFCSSLTGYSGGGKKMIAEYEANLQEDGYLAPRPYALTQTHKHLKEMAYMTGLTHAPIFQPIVFPVFSGMAVSVPLSLAGRKIGKEDVFCALQTHYKGQPIVRVLMDGASIDNGFLSPIALKGRDDMEIVVLGNDDRVTVTAVFDNLGKGASGAAVECMNLMLGKEITTGLSL